MSACLAYATVASATLASAAVVLLAPHALCAQATPPSGSQSTNVSLSIQSGHSDRITALAVTPDGRFLVSGSDDNSLIVWDTAGRQIRRFEGHHGPVVALALGADGSVVSAASDSQPVFMWNIARARTLSSAAVQHRVRSLAIDPAGGTLAVGTTNDVQLFDARTLVKRGRLREPGFVGRLRAGVWGGAAMAFLGTDRLLVFDTVSVEIHLWDLPTSRIVQTYKAFRHDVTAIAASANGRVFATASIDSTITLWSPESAVPLHKLRLGAPAIAVAVAREGDWVAGSSSEGGLVVWRRAWGDSVWSVELDRSPKTTLAFEPDGRHLLVGDAFGLIIRVPLDSRANANIFIGSVDRSQAIAVGSGALFVGAGKTLWRWDLTNSRVDWFTGHTQRITALAATRDGSIALTGASDSSVRLWNLATGQRWRLPLEGPVRAVALDSSGRAAFGFANGWIGIWRYAFGRGRPGVDSLLYVRDEGGVRSLSFDSDGSRLVASTDSGVTIWNLDKCVAERGAEYSCEPRRPRFAEGPFRMKYFNDARLSPNGRYLLAASSVADTAARLYDLRGDEPLRRYAEHTGGIAAVAFLPGGDQFFTAGFDGLVKQWDLDRDRSALQTFTGAGTAVLGLDVAPDGRYVYGVGADGAVRVWDVRSRQLIATLTTKEAEEPDVPSWAVTAPDGRFDTNSFELVQNLYWVTPDAPMSLLPLESFMREYYQPRLLAMRIAGKPLPPVRDVAGVNRSLPPVRIETVSTHLRDPSMLRVVVNVGRAVAPGPGTTASLPTHGEYDLRLFRDGQLVGRVANAASGRHEFTVRVAPASSGDSVTLTAYAFNGDRVKGETTMRRYALAGIPARPRTAYLVVVGVGQNRDASYSLASAPYDALSVLDSLGDALRASKEFTSVEPIAMVSLPPPMALNRSSFVSLPPDLALPSRENIRTVIDILAGRRADSARRAMLPPGMLRRLRAAQPGDAVILSFTMHGLVDPARGEFVVLPFDATEPAAGGGRAAARPASPVIEPAGTARASRFPRAISSTDLSTWIADIDAGSLVLILSTCYSEQAVATEGFRPGPMGEPGFGQLAYDKGMQVLVAAQREAQGSGEVTRLGRALTIDGPGWIRGRAPARLTDLLRYAERHVPELARDDAAGVAPEQAPQLFDFRRRRNDVVLYTKR